MDNITSNHTTAPPKEEWTHQDEGDCNRLVTEMQEDARWQIQLFTFALTVTAIILGVISKLDSSSITGMPAGLVFLSPLIVLIPTSLMILNRARTRNRKAAFMLVSLDYKRLRIAGVKDDEPLIKVQRRKDLPWETHLHIVERMDSQKNPHLAPALMYMASCSVFMEWLCIGLAFWVSRAGHWLVPTGIAAVLLVDLALVVFRLRGLYHLKGVNSIQGYAVAWLARPRDSDVYLYLRDFVDRYPDLRRKKGPLRF
jgi:uncharacterized membrane protein YhaH (DUF805 family)